MTIRGSGKRVAWNTLTRRVPRAVAALLTLAVTSGCYTYSPTPLDMASPGMDVRFHASGPAAETLRVLAAPALGSDNSLQVRGTIVSRDDDSLLVQIPVTVRQQGLLQSTVGQNVWLDSEDVLLLERRQLDPVRTGLMAAFVAGAAAAMVHLITVDAIRPTTPLPGDGEGEAESRIPLFHIRIPCC